MAVRIPHHYDDDGICTKCGFDGAEWHHWRHQTHEGAAADAAYPSCTAPAITVLPYMGKPVEVEKTYRPLTVFTDGVKRTRAIIVEGNE